MKSNRSPLTIVSPQRESLLADIGYILARAKIGIEDISTVSHGGKAVVHLVLRDASKARAALERNGYEVLGAKGMVVARIPDCPNERLRMAQTLAQNGIETGPMRELACGEGQVVVGLDTNNGPKARKLLQSALICNVSMN